MDIFLLSDRELEALLNLPEADPGVLGHGEVGVGKAAEHDAGVEEDGAVEVEPEDKKWEQLGHHCLEHRGCEEHEGGPGASHLRREYLTDDDLIMIKTSWPYFGVKLTCVCLIFA